MTTKLFLGLLEKFSDTCGYFVENQDSFRSKYDRILISSSLKFAISCKLDICTNLTSYLSKMRQNPILDIFQSSVTFEATKILIYFFHPEKDRIPYFQNILVVSRRFYNFVEYSTWEYPLPRVIYLGRGMPPHKVIFNDFFNFLQNLRYDSRYQNTLDQMLLEEFGDVSMPGTRFHVCLKDWKNLENSMKIIDFTTLCWNASERWKQRFWVKSTHPIEYVET